MTMRERERKGKTNWKRRRNETRTRTDWTGSARGQCEVRLEGHHELDKANSPPAA
jgi:hypothetical protein